MSSIWHRHIQRLLTCLHRSLPLVHRNVDLFILHLSSLSTLLSHLFISSTPTVLMMWRGEIGCRVSGGSSDVIAKAVLIGCCCHGGKLQKCTLGKVLAVWPWQVTLRQKVDYVGWFWLRWSVITDDSCCCCFCDRGNAPCFSGLPPGGALVKKTKQKNKTHAALSWWCGLTSKDIWNKNSARTERLLPGLFSQSASGAHKMT